MATLKKVDKSLPTVSEKDLKYLSGQLKEEWTDLGRNLGIIDPELYNIKTDYRESVKEAKYQMLIRWKNKNGQQATHNVLAQALEDVDRLDLSQVLRNGNPSQDPLSETPIPTSKPTLVPTAPTSRMKYGYGQFCLKLESILTRQHIHIIASRLGYSKDKIDYISNSDTPSRVLVQIMDEISDIDSTDISKLVMALEDEDVVVKIKEMFELYGKFYEQFLLYVESILTSREAVLLAECFGYLPKTIDSIRKNDKPSRYLIQLMCEFDDISPTDSSKLIRTLKHDSMGLGDVPVKVKEAFELLQKKNQFVKELKIKYRNLCGGLFPVPFLHDKYNIDELFVESGIKFLENKQGDDEGREKWKTIKDHNVIFTDPQIKSNRRIVDGEPGYGKSTLALQITNEWCQDIAPVRDFEILILLRLRQFRKVSNIYRAIKTFLLPRDSKLTMADIKSILDSSLTAFLLDGYDEYPGRGKKETDIEYIIRGDMFQNHQVVLMTRTSCLPQDSSYDTKRIRLTGFDDTVRCRYIRQVVTNDDTKKAGEINQLLTKNQAAADLCKVPMFCVMISHMAKRKTLEHFDTVTNLFRSIIECFHRHEQIRAEINVKRRKVEHDHRKLDKTAFEALKIEAQEITLDETEMREKVGDDLYDEYVSIGILREEEVFDDDDYAYKTETRFFHKLFAEWYAAHYLADKIAQLSAESGPFHLKQEDQPGKSEHTISNSESLNLLSSLDPKDVHYAYRFACGLNKDAALQIIKHLGKNGAFREYTLMCILEWMIKWKGRLETIEDTVSELCSRGLDIGYTDSLMLQKCTIDIFKFASRRKIPIYMVRLFNSLDSCGSDDTRVKPSNLSLPVLDTLSFLEIYEYGRVIKEKEAAILFQYSSKCLSLTNLQFNACLLPRYIKITDSVDGLKGRQVIVRWYTGNRFYRLNLESGQWEAEWCNYKSMTDEQHLEEIEEAHKRNEEWKLQIA